MAYNTKETILRYDCVGQMWYAWTNVPAHLTKFCQQNWERTDEEYDDGRLVAAQFAAPKQFITIGNVNRKPRAGKIVFFVEKRPQGVDAK